MRGRRDEEQRLTRDERGNKKKKYSRIKEAKWDNWMKDRERR